MTNTLQEKVLKSWENRVPLAAIAVQHKISMSEARRIIMNYIREQAANFTFKPTYTGQIRQQA
jgi:hypothetical protein